MRRLSDRNPLESHAFTLAACKKRKNLDVGSEPFHVANGLSQVFALPRFKLQRRNSQPIGVIGAVLVGNQDHPANVVDTDQKAQLLGDPFFFAVSVEMPGQACRSAGNREPVVTRQLKLIVEQIINLLTEAPVAAIHRGSTNPIRVESNGTGVTVFIFARHAFSIRHRRKLVQKRRRSQKNIAARVQ